MQIDVEEAKDRLDDLVDIAKAGEEVILLVSGRPAVYLVAVEDPSSQLDIAANP